jgi:hypothetical protein
MLLLAIRSTVTTTLPVVAPVGTVTVIDVALQFAMLAAVVPLNVTVLVPCVVPKFAPVIVTDAPVAPDVGARLTMFEATVNQEPLLTTPLTTTTTFPVVAPVGTVATIEVAFQLVIVVAVVPLNVTVLVPCVKPKFVPVIVTDAPTPPDAGDRLVMFGVGNIVKLTPLLATPPTVTTTLPVVAPAGTGTTMLASFQLVRVAVSPLNVYRAIALRRLKTKTLNRLARSFYTILAILSPPMYRRFPTSRTTTSSITCTG